MPSNELSSAWVTPSVPKCILGDRRRTTVWLSGEHDAASREHLASTLAEASGRDDNDIVVDLSGVTFMDASTIGALVFTRNWLLALSRSLRVCDPSPPARRLLNVCGLSHMIEERGALPQPVAGTALGTWVAVPPRPRRDLASLPSPRKAPLSESARALPGAP